jgi:hypothetical protein
MHIALNKSHLILTPCHPVLIPAYQSFATLKLSEVSFETLITLMSIGCKAEVALGGKNTSFMFDKFAVCGGNGQLSTRSNFFYFYLLSRCFICSHSFKMSKVIRAFLLATYIQPKAYLHF